MNNIKEYSGLELDNAISYLTQMVALSVGIVEQVRESGEELEVWWATNFVPVMNEDVGDEMHKLTFRLISELLNTGKIEIAEEDSYEYLCIICESLRETTIKRLTKHISLN